MKPMPSNFNYPFKKINSPIKKLKEINNRYIFPVSWLNTQQYCECNFYLWLLGYSPKKTKKMEEGEQQHSARESTFKPTTKEQIIESSIDEKLDFYIFRTSLFSLKEQLIGIQDEIVSLPSKKRLIIIEQKPGDSVFQSDKLQAYGYALTFIDQFSQELENDPPRPEGRGI